MTLRALPTGTLTFLFSDMEGSTRLVQELGTATFGAVLERHNAILRETFARHGGTERGTQGDSFLVMFPEAPSAIAAAVDAQRAIVAADWPTGAPSVRVRMGLHTGVGTLGGDDYVSVDVNRAARVAGAAHGGQVLMSDATRALTETALPDGASLRSLGEHRLKDLASPEHLHQLVIDGLQADFPPPRTLGRATGNLPARFTSFIGREAELAELAGLLGGNRLVTLTGPGGTGKTSLGLELARRVAADYEHGAWFVPLELVGEARLVGAAIASRLGLVESAGASAEERLRSFVADRRLLLVLDNFEHVLDAAAGVGKLLASGPDVRIVVTSRAALRLGGEQEFPVRPLAVPAHGASTGRAPVDAVQLFIDRARRVSPSFEPGPADLDAIGDIVRRLDGLPLGIEIAASRIGLLPPRQIADRLAQRLDLPGPTARDQPERRRTMAGAIGWSHDMLTEPTRHLLARLSVFAGGCGLAEAEAVCGQGGDLGVDVLDGIAGLVEQSLVMAVPGPTEARFRLLDTVRMFAAERLADLGETTAIRDRHLAAYLDVAERAAPLLPSRHQRLILRRLGADHANLRSAVGWAIESGNADAAMRLVGSLWRYWQMQGHLQEGTQAAAAVLAMPGAADATVDRVRLLDAAGGLAYWRNDLNAAHRFYRDQVELARGVGDKAELANALYNASFTARIHEGDWQTTFRLQGEARELYRDVGDERGIVRLDWTMATNLMSEGRVAEAEDVLLRMYPRFVELDDVYYLAMATDTLAWAALAKGNEVEALRWSARSLKTYRALGDVAGRTIGLAGIAVMLLAAGLPREAGVVRAAFDALTARHLVRPPILLETIIGGQWAPEALAARLSPDEVAAAQREGAEMTLEEVVDLVVGLVEERFGELETPLVAPEID